MPVLTFWNRLYYIRDEERRVFLAAYKSRLKNIEGQKSLTYPTLDQFDDRLRPLQSAVTQS